MIGSLEGRIDSLDADSFIIDVNGVGYRVITAAKSLLELVPNKNPVRIYTYLNVKEDDLQLYGFSEPEEKYIFEKLIAVSKVGPKIAAMVLLSFTPAQVVNYISSGSADFLAAVPGIGKKTAQRIILELKDKIGASSYSDTMLPDDNSIVSEAKGALVALGYTQNEALEALRDLTDIVSAEDAVRKALLKMAK